MSDSLLCFFAYVTFFLTHILIVEFSYHLADPRLLLFLSRPIISPLVCPPLTESEDLESTVGEVVVRETAPLVIMLLWIC